MCILFPPLVDIGPRVTDPSHLEELWTTRRNSDAQKALAQRLGPIYQYSEADHFYVPAGAKMGQPQYEDGLLVAFLARFVRD